MLSLVSELNITTSSTLVKNSGANVLRNGAFNNSLFN